VAAPTTPATAGGGTQEPQSLVRRLVDLALSALPAIGGTIGFVGFVAVIGGAIQWVRFQSAQLPAAQAVHVTPRGELVAIGAQSLILFTLLGLLAIVIVYLADPRGEGNVATARALAVVAALEFVAVLLLVHVSALALLAGALVVIGLLLLVPAAIGPAWDFYRHSAASRRLADARRNWESAAETARLARASYEAAHVEDATAELKAAAALRLVEAEQRLLEAELEWRRIVDDLEPVMANPAFE
jgi:hypothetical protein